jgi:hypothetical protein
MRARPVLAAIAALALIAAPAAANAKAKPKPKTVKKYCSLLVDDGKNDGKSDVYAFESSPSLDIISGDIATGPKTMVAVLRLASTDFNIATDHWAATLGYDWSFATSSNYGQKFTFKAKFDQYQMDASKALTGSADIDNAGVTLKSFKVDTSAHTFTWVIDRSVDKTLTRKNTVFKQFRANDNSFGASADGAPNQNPTSASYPDRALSCVHAD